MPADAARAGAIVVALAGGPKLGMYGRYLRKQGYEVVEEPGVACAVLVATAEQAVTPAIRAWGRGTSVPKLVLGGEPPADWQNATKLELPLLPIQLEQRIQTLVQGEASAAAARWDLLIVDDDATIRAAAAAAFQPLGFRVRGCEGFADVTGALLKGRPDFILLDLNLPGFSGQSLGGFLKHRQIPTAVFSSVPAEELEAAREQLGAVAAFPKGTSFTVIGRWIREHLEQRP